ncbi:hypothetical protein EU537_07485 [Candidatus Thorarchaeota archaeon]|nr:MAG: hypothetical protein EU537_07485 [Candidatus Thorarchaeota archaeon]
MPKKGNKKSTKRKSSRLSVLVLILLTSNIATVAYFLVLDDSVPAEDVPMGIADITGENMENFIGKVVSVLGFYIYAADHHMLVSNPLVFFNNSLDSQNHIVITGTIPESMGEYRGYEIRVKGIFDVFRESDGTGELVFDSYFKGTTSDTYPGVYTDAIHALPESIPFDQFDLTETKYAVLYSGGINVEKAYYRYWNDIIYMYFILQMHGYQAENIYVIYKDGISEDGYTPVDHPATHTSLDTVFGDLADEMGSRDTLFFYTTNHGGSGGISVWGPMDNTGALTHSQVGNWLDAITCRHMIIVMEQCVSGKFISYLSAENRVIMTACADNQNSYGADTEGAWDEFVYHFMCGLVSFSFHDPQLTINADYDNDGLISMKEAFVYAAVTDSRNETPWYNDNGDGQGYTAAQAVFNLPDSYGDGIFL